MTKTTVTPEQYLKTPITRRNGSVYCRKCERHLGELEFDGVSIKFSNVRLYGRNIRYFCLCGKPYNFCERDLGGHSSRDLPEPTREILHDLGKAFLLSGEQRKSERERQRQLRQDDDQD